jgi:zinc finger protein xfin
MDKFLVDLDSVLDELEAKEATTCIINETNCNSAVDKQFGGLTQNSKEADQEDDQSKLSQIKLASFSEVNVKAKSLVSCSLELYLVGQGSVNNQGQATKIDDLIKANLVDFKKEDKADEEGNVKEEEIKHDQEKLKAEAEKGKEKEEVKEHNDKEQVVEEEELIVKREEEELEAEVRESKEEKEAEKDEKEEKAVENDDKEKVLVEVADLKKEEDDEDDDKEEVEEEEEKERVEEEEEEEEKEEEEEREKHEAVADQLFVDEEVNFISFDSVLPDQDVFKKRDDSECDVNDEDDQRLDQNKKMKSNSLIDDKFKDESLNSKPLSFDNCQVDDINEEEMNKYLSDIESCPNQSFIDSNVETNESSDLLLATHCSSSISNLTESERLLNANLSTSSSPPVSADSVHDCQLEEKSLETKLSRPSNLFLSSSLTSSASSSFSSTPSEMTNSLTSPFSSQPLLNSSNSENVENLESNLLQEPSEAEENDIESPRPTVGVHQPFWIPDNEADNCMLCENKFTVIKRRHHCRICGKVLCSQCCRSRAKIPYMFYKEARVCYICFALLTKESAQIASNSIHSLTSRNENNSDNSLLGSTLNSNFENSNGTGTVRGENVVTVGSRNEPSSSNLSTTKPVGVLKKGPKPKGSEPKQVIFFDGIRPGGDLTNDQLGNCYFKQRSPKKIKSPTIEKLHSSSGSSKGNLKYNRIIIEDKKGPLPPIINNPKLEADPTFENLFSFLKDESLPPVTFLLTKNLLILIKCVKLDCCLGTECWTFTSQGLAPVGQDEIVIVLERLAEDNFIPRELFRMFTNVYDSSTRGLINTFVKTV